MKRQELDTGWTLTRIDGPLPDDYSAIGAAGGIAATVPGCVHTDLLAAGLIPDPHDGTNEDALAWIGRTIWRYSTSFDAAEPAEGERIDLACSGLDTIATIEINGVVIAETANQHRSYRFDLRPFLRAGRNRLDVTFDAALDYAERMSEEYGPLPHVNAHPYNTIRKMACNFGWDWGPDVTTAGIWRPIALERWFDARLGTVRPLVEVGPSGDGMVTVHVDVERALAGRARGDDGPITVAATVGAVSVEAPLAAGATSVVLLIDVPQPEIWWPRGYGAQPLSDLEVTLLAKSEVVDRWTRRIGFRTVELDLTPDEDGIPFTVVINGQPVFVKGVNWIPDDSLITRLDRAAYSRRIDQAVGAGVNLLRVWGGGIYESDDFYELADERGLLVWQDFLFACAGYPEAEPLYSEVEAEAREAVTRLTPHPSLILWNGGNEDIVAYAEWHGMRAAIGDRPWGDGYYSDMLPRIVAELDPTRPYSPNSPFSFGAYSSPNEQNLGTVHIWDVWNTLDYTHYADWMPRFVAEFGFQGPPAWSTLTSVVHDSPMDPNGVEMLVHQKAGDGNNKLARGLAPHLPMPVAAASGGEAADWPINDWHWATQLNQARAISFGISHFRAQQPRCMGSIIWQLNDCWPVVSWAMVDGNGHAKPAWFALRDVYAERLLTFQPRGRKPGSAFGTELGGELTLVAINDTAEVWSGEVVLARRGLGGEEITDVAVALEIPSRSTVDIVVPRELVPTAVALGGVREVLSAVASGARRALWFAEEDVAAGLTAPTVTAPILDAVASPLEGEESGYLVTVIAREFVRDLSLFPDRLDPRASVDESLITLFPGEACVFRVASDEDLDLDALTSSPVLRSANDLFGAAVGVGAVRELATARRR